MPFTRLRGLSWVPLATAVAATLAACGGGADGGKFSTAVVPQQLQVSASPGGALKWDGAQYTAQAGAVTFVVENPSPLAHQFGVEGNGVSYQSPQFGAGTTQRYTIEGLQPGTYRIVCNYPGHKSAGMVATLIVR